MSDLSTKPEVIDPTTGGPLEAHIVKKNDQMRGYLGEEIEALCGKKFIPHRDYKDLPVCQTCKGTLEQIRNTPSN
jgi:hypothetical protein